MTYNSSNREIILASLVALAMRIKNGGSDSFFPQGTLLPRVVVLSLLLSVVTTTQCLLVHVFGVVGSGPTSMLCGVRASSFPYLSELSPFYVC